MQLQARFDSLPELFHNWQKTEFYDEYEDMVSVMTSNQIKDFNGKKLPSIIEYVPLDEDGNKTIIERLVWQFDIDINQRYFLPSYMKNLR